MERFVKVVPVDYKRVFSQTAAGADHQHLFGPCSGKWKEADVGPQQGKVASRRHHRAGRAIDIQFVGPALARIDQICPGERIPISLKQWKN